MVVCGVGGVMTWRERVALWRSSAGSGRYVSRVYAEVSGYMHVVWWRPLRGARHKVPLRYREIECGARNTIWNTLEKAVPTDGRLRIRATRIEGGGAQVTQTCAAGGFGTHIETTL